MGGGIGEPEAGHAVLVRRPMPTDATGVNEANRPGQPSIDAPQVVGGMGYRRVVMLAGPSRDITIPNP